MIVPTKGDTELLHAEIKLLTLRHWSYFLCLSRNDLARSYCCWALVQNSYAGLSHSCCAMKRWVRDSLPWILVTNTSEDWALPIQAIGQRYWCSALVKEACYYILKEIDPPRVFVEPCRDSLGHDTCEWGRRISSPLRIKDRKAVNMQYNKMV